MSITAAQRLARRNYLGSSDMAAVLGVDPYRSVYDIWVSKTQELSDDDAPDNEAIEIGNDFEAPLVKWAARELSSRVETDPDKLEFRHPTEPIFVTHIDGILLDLPGEGLEAKSTSLTEGWGTPGTDEVPDRVITQSTYHMAVTGFNRIHVPVLTGKFGLKRELYVVERNDKLIEIILAKGRDFWLNHVVPRIPPDASAPPSIELLRRIKREPGTWAEVDEAIIDAYLAANDAYLAADKANKAAKAELIAKLGNAEGARHPYGIVTYYEQRAKDKIDLDLLRTKYPDVYAEISTSSTNRVLRFKKNK